MAQNSKPTCWYGTKPESQCWYSTKLKILMLIWHKTQNINFDIAQNSDIQVLIWRKTHTPGVDLAQNSKSKCWYGTQLKIQVLIWHKAYCWYDTQLKIQILIWHRNHKPSAGMAQNSKHKCWYVSKLKIQVLIWHRTRNRNVDMAHKSKSKFSFYSYITYICTYRCTFM